MGEKGDNRCAQRKQGFDTGIAHIMVAEHDAWRPLDGGLAWLRQDGDFPALQGAG
jgi:hypothetical protein